MKTWDKGSMAKIEWMAEVNDEGREPGCKGNEDKEKSRRRKGNGEEI